MQRIDVLSSPDYLPSLNDVMRARVRTTGIVQENYCIDGSDFVMFDVGGQRNERRKWIHCFDNVTAVIFVAALSEYDQALFEDRSQNRMDEAINLFSEISNGKYFKETSIILFLNKKDLFEKKIKKVDIRLLQEHKDEEEDVDELGDRYLDYTHGLCTCGGGYPSDYECTCGVQDKGKKYFLDKFISSYTGEARWRHVHL